MESDSELRYSIRAKAQLLCSQADMIYELRTQIHAYLDNPLDAASYKKAGELCAALSNLTKQSGQLTKEINNEMSELNKSRRIAIMRSINDKRI